VATQYGAEGICCNAVAPGLIATEPLREGMPKPLQDAVVANKLVGRLGEPRDIAEAVRFLASDRSAFITGEIVAVDGGSTRRSRASTRSGARSPP
jgi:NAD(P)-dependent dehydrogenase (short-subunit alcohol dehydrogenase family)